MLEQIYDCLRLKIAEYVGQYDIRQVLDASRKCRLWWKSTIGAVGWYGSNTIALYYGAEELIRYAPPQNILGHIIEICKLGKYESYVRFVETKLIPAVLARSEKRIVWAALRDNVQLFTDANNGKPNMALTLLCKYIPEHSAETLAVLLAEHRLPDYLEILSYRCYARSVKSLNVLINDVITSRSAEGASMMSRVMDTIIRCGGILQFDESHIIHLTYFENTSIIDAYIHYIIPYLGPDPKRLSYVYHNRVQLHHIANIIGAYGRWPMWVECARKS